MWATISNGKVDSLSFNLIRARATRLRSTLIMAVSYKTSSGVALDISDNLCRWDGNATGHYEVWFLTLNERAGQRGFWFRYAIESPDGRGRPAARPAPRSGPPHRPQSAAP